jgi:ABC-type spermidine/putrescine transport system permease subunit I
MASSLDPFDREGGGVTGASLIWLNVRHQAFYVTLVAPVVFLIAVFFLLPLLSMLLRSVEPSAQFDDEIAPPLSASASIIELHHGNLAEVSNVKVKFVRPLAVSAVEPTVGTVTLVDIPPPGGLLLLSYSGRQREIVLRRPPGARSFTVRNPPIRSRNADGIGSVADVSAAFEWTVTPAAIDAVKGLITLPPTVERGATPMVSYSYRTGVTLANYSKIFANKFYFDWDLSEPSLIRNTFEIALFTTLGCMFLGYPVAYLMASVGAGWRTVLVALVIVPFWTSVLVRTFAWQVILGNRGFLNYVLQEIGVTAEPLALVFNRFAVYVGMVRVMLPFLILPTYAMMRGIPQEPLRAAASLGASPQRVFLRVYLPLSMPGLSAGALIVFIFSLGFFVTPALLGSAADRMLSNLVAVQFDAAGDWGFGAALSFVLLVPTAILYVLYMRVVRLQDIYGAGINRKTVPWRAQRARADAPRAGRFGD